MWLCSSHTLKRQASLCNLKLLSEMVGYGVSAPVTKFSHSERAKLSPPHRAKGVQWAQGSSCGHRTSWRAALNHKPRRASGSWQAPEARFSGCWEWLGHLALSDTGPGALGMNLHPSDALSPWFSSVPLPPRLLSDSHPNHSPASLAHHVF